MGLEFGVELVFTRLFLDDVEILAAEHYCRGYHKNTPTVSFLSNNTTLPPLSPVAR